MSLLLLTVWLPGLAGATLEARAARRAEGAQEAPPPRGPRNRTPDAGDEAAGVPTGELVKMLDAYAVLQAQNALSLTDAQYGQFVTRLRQLQETRRRNQRERNLPGHQPCAQPGLQTSAR